MADRADSNSKVMATFPPKCYYCNGNGFSSKDEYERHGIKHHKPLYPGYADLQSLGLKPQDMPWEEELSVIRHRFNKLIVALRTAVENGIKFMMNYDGLGLCDSYFVLQHAKRKNCLRLGRI